MGRAVVVAALVMTSATALAQGASYRALVDEAVGEFDAGRFAEARALFEEAHAIAPSARTFRGIGLASFELGDWLTAHRAMSAALADPRRPLNASQTAEARDLIARAARFLGCYRVVTAPAGAQLELDGRAVSVEPNGCVLAPLGEHLLVARAEGHRHASVALIVRGGEEELVRLELTAEPADTEAAGREQAGTQPMGTRPTGTQPTGTRPTGTQPTGTQPTGTQPTGTQPTGTQPTGTTESATEHAHVAAAPLGGAPHDPVAAIVVLSVGGASAIASMATGLAWWLTMDEEVAACAHAGPACRNASALAERRDAAAGTTVGLALLGSAFLVASALMEWAGTADGALACIVVPGGLSCSSRF